MRLTTKLADWARSGTKQTRLARRKSFGWRTQREAISEILEERRVMSATGVAGGATDVTLGSGREWVVANQGDDWNAGSVEQPFLTIRRALDAAQPGDVITLRNGVYEGGINIDVDQLTIRSMPGEWAVIESPLTQQTDGRANSVIRYGFDVEGGLLKDVEITGGYYYGVMFWDWWDSDFSDGSTHMGASGITLDGVKVHDTGVDAIKITPGANDISILNSEVYNSGRRTTQSADGIDNNNGDRMLVRNSYIHDVPGVGILTSGGTEDSLIERNLVKDTGGAGIVNGFYTELEWIEPDSNPGHFASIDTVVRNNIIVAAGHAGVGIYGALNAQVYNNTIVNAADDAQAPIQFGGYEMWVSNTAPSYEHIASVNPSVLNNIIVTNPDNLTRMVDIREGSISGGLTLDYNLYYGTSTRGVLFIDRNLTGDGTPEQTFSQWKNNYGYDTHSLIADPQLDASWHLLANSPAIGASGLGFQPEVDFDGNPRQAGSLSHDIGADEFNTGTIRATPPAAFGAPAIEIAERGYHDYEANTINVKVVRHGSTTDTVTVSYTTLGGSAVAGVDFTSVAGTLTFAPGETEKVVAVQLLADSAAEGDEHFLFTLSNAITDGTYPVRLGHQATASMTIDDEDTPLTLHYATKFVSNDGSDVTGDGSAANPWHSLQHAADNVGPGDYVIVQPGKYWGFNLTTDGKPDARITFHAMPGVEIDEAFPGQQDGINLEGADYVTVEGFYIHDMPRAGLRSVNNDGVILRGNNSDHNGYWGILTGWSENIIVENNITTGSQREHGIYISNSADGAIIRNNVSFGNRASGIQFNADRYLPGDGIHSNNLIEGNVIFENGRGGGAALNLDGVQDSVIRNNLLYDNHATGIVLYVGFAADGSKNNVVTNNTVVMAEDARWALLMTDGSSGNVLTNNILLNKNPNRGSMTVEANSLPALSDHNVVQDLFQMDGYNGSFASWQTFAGGADAHSIVVNMADPPSELAKLFVDPAGDDYHLKSGSAAIDAGLIGDGSNVSAVTGDATHSSQPSHWSQSHLSHWQPTTDIFGHARPTGSGIDIGAYESGIGILPVGSGDESGNNSDRLEAYPTNGFTPSVQFESANVIGYEFIGMSEVAITRTGDTEGTLTVTMTSSNGSASSDDYQAVNETVTFNPGESRKTIRVFVTDDSEIEPPETVNLSLHVVGHDSIVPEHVENVLHENTTLHIISDDAWLPGSFEFDAQSVSVNEADGTATLTVKRVGGSSGAAFVSFETTAFTPPKQATWIKRHTDLLYPTDRDTPATAGDDYLPTMGLLNFADGQTEQTITIPLVNDAWYEGGEAFVVKLSDPTNGTKLGVKSSVKVHIDSDDAKQPGTFEFAAASYTVTEGTPSINVTINRLNGGNVEASVRLYDTGAGNGSTTASAWAGSDYAFLPGLLTFAPGEMSKTLSIPITDDTSTEIDEVFSIQLYSPSNDATIGSVSKTTVTIQDNESTISFQYPSGQWNYSVMENAGSVPVTVVRQGSLATPASVRINTSESSALANVDFTPVDVTLNFAPGESSKVINIPLINDSLVEPTESFSVSMSNVVGATQGSWSAWANILNDDTAASPGKFELSAASFSVVENAGNLIVTVNRVGGSDGTVTVQYRTLDGAYGMPSTQTAWAGSDYSSKSGTLTFAPGETSKTFAVPITNDTSVEQSEYFSLQLRNPSGGATLGTINKAVVTILEDDSSIEFGTSSYTVNESVGYVTITLVRKGSVSGAATVDLNISGGSATGGVDFILPANKTVTFADGEATKQIQVQIIDDLFKENDEMFYLSLTNAVGSKLGSSQWGNVKIGAND